MDPNQIRVLVVDDHPVLREGVAVLVSQQPDLLMVGEASTGREALAYAALTDREVEVLALIAAGNSNRSIATRLAINEGTAKTHVKNILAKLGTNDRTHAVTVALRRGIIQL